jgi:ATP-dependent Clp protease ATP-binding subunit ClpA
MDVPTRKDILKKQKKTEKKLMELLKAVKREDRFDEIAEIIYSETSPDGMMDIIKILTPKGANADLKEIVATVNDAWNYFPHEIIGGMCPADLLLTAHGKLP